MPTIKIMLWRGLHHITEAPPGTRVIVDDYDFHEPDEENILVDYDGDRFKRYEYEF